MTTFLLPILAASVPSLRLAPGHPRPVPLVALCPSCALLYVAVTVPEGAAAAVDAASARLAGECPDHPHRFRVDA